jgi:hypothetical protein
VWELSTHTVPITGNKMAAHPRFRATEEDGLLLLRNIDASHIKPQI